MPPSRSPSGDATVGSIARTRAAGFNGIAATTWAGAPPTTAARSGDGGRSRDTSRPSGTTASDATSSAGGGSARRCCTGRMTADESSLLALHALFDGPWTVGRLVRFHTEHKLTLL